ncbi:MAG TPA: poly-gamma-glutamate hydrolase family protein [Burkholderiales bacterium]|nr:poly-gamma-glutamate hydrolase family protein [Burkholderiales bacterium]
MVDPVLDTTGTVLFVADKYRNFHDLASHEREGTDFGIAFRDNASSFAIVAPPGGGIEPGTSEIADAIAGEDFSFYAFEGLKPDGNSDLHITSTRFDECRCLSLVARARTIITVHGRDVEDQVVFVGGLNSALGRRIAAALERVGIKTSHHDDPTLQGLSPTNICNRGTSVAGVQLEIAVGLRRMMFQSLNATGRESRTVRFAQFTEALRRVLV